MNKNSLKKYIYLDHNATSPIKPSVLNKMSEVWDTLANPSSIHQRGKTTRHLVNDSRRIIAHFIDTHEDTLIFTSGGTESNGTVLNPSLWDMVFISPTEHESIHKPVSHYWPLSPQIKLMESGLIDLDDLENKLKINKGKRILVSIHWANNETGIIQPLEQIIEIAHRNGAYVHSDGVQILGKIPFSFEKMDLDYLTLSAHKMGGPQGIGALVIKNRVPYISLLWGGMQEKGRRAGTENISGIIGWSECIQTHDFGVYDNLRKYHSHMETDLKHFVKDTGFALEIVGKNGPRLPSTTCLLMPDVSNQLQLIKFDCAHIAVSSGAACSSGTVKSSRILQNMGYSATQSETALRISSGWSTSHQDLITFSNEWKKIFMEHLNNRQLLSDPILPIQRSA